MKKVTLLRSVILTLVLSLMFFTWQGTAQNVYLDENFDVDIPADWTITNDGACVPGEWFWTTDRFGSTLDGTPFAIADSDADGSGCLLITQLITPEFDLGTMTVLDLEFDQYYNNIGADFADVDVWDGAQWVNVLHMTSDMGGFSNPDHQVIDVKDYANAEFKVRFLYEGNWAWYWAVDNVKLSGIPFGLASIEGFLTDGGTGNPIEGAKVTHFDKYTYSGTDGYYYLETTPLITSDVVYTKAGYTDIIIPDVTLNIGDVIVWDQEMFEALIPVSGVVAELREVDLEVVDVTWGVPNGFYEIIYDDNTFENIVGWLEAGSWWALKFTPADYPCTVWSGSVNIGDGTYPPGSVLNQPFSIAIFDDDGPNGYPGFGTYSIITLCYIIQCISTAGNCLCSPHAPVACGGYGGAYYRCKHIAKLTDSSCKGAFAIDIYIF